MKKFGFKKLARTRLGSFLRREDGSIAVEGAMVLSVLSIGFVGLADVGLASYKHAQMNSALRSAAQHIINEGSSTQLVEELFRLNYKDPNASFTSRLVCRCARERVIAAGTVDPQAEPPAPLTEDVSVVQQQDGTWGQCSLACGEQALIKYVGFETSAVIKAMIKPDDTPVSASLYVRVE